MTAYLFWISLICLSFTKAQANKCGYVDQCEKLVSVSIFQSGPCGRAARCNWERMHLHTHLLGTLPSTVDFEKNIKKALCLLPTYGTHKSKDITDPREFYRACKDEAKSSSASIFSEFHHYPMTTQYKSRDGTQYLKRMEECMKMEFECNNELNNDIHKLCQQLLSKPLPEVSPSLKLRDQPAYKHDPLMPCRLHVLHRIREPPPNSDPTAPPRYEDKYEQSKIFADVRKPYFDLYLLYRADPYSKLSSIPSDDREWNEMKVYQRLAHYLPPLMVHHINDAIHCIYNRVKSAEMKWKPERFCGVMSTFVCVELVKLVNNDCGNTIFDLPTNAEFIPRHNTVLLNLNTTSSVNG